MPQVGLAGVAGVDPGSDASASPLDIAAGKKELLQLTGTTIVLMTVRSTRANVTDWHTRAVTVGSLQLRLSCEPVATSEVVMPSVSAPDRIGGDGTDRFKRQLSHLWPS